MRIRPKLEEEESTSFSMARARALVIGPLGACGGDGVSLWVAEGAPHHVFPGEMHLDDVLEVLSEGNMP